ncbi:hypothetical protein KFL_003930070 [Klebsormidium nitens]|uniref:TF-B3 domain-containing protein n=1 Tax=Klebsormidium nitens TaxID=105231 RepID=A0A0U9HKF6_KLENI|nr:hypothetical protein KFL_003930070 [Klebsormidium nitens]|eukprot:GAQ88004.1 hypothetical protein KFL_003930070 [Klebsormidium nitens]
MPSSGRRMVALFHPLIVKQEPLDEAPQTSHDPSFARPPFLEVKLEVFKESSQSRPTPTSSQSSTPASPQRSALIDPSKGPEGLHEAKEGEFRGVRETKDVASDKASAVEAENSVRDLDPWGRQMHSQSATAGSVDALGGEATDGALHAAAQDECSPLAPCEYPPPAQAAAADEAERLREDLRKMSVMMARLQDKVLATCGQTTEEFAEVQRLLDKNQSLLHQPLALEQGFGSRIEPSEGALVEWKSGVIDREGSEGERGGGSGASETEQNGTANEKGAPGEADAPDMFGSSVTGVRSTDSENRQGALGRSSPSEAGPRRATMSADVDSAGGPCTPGKDGPVVAPQRGNESICDIEERVLAALGDEPRVRSSKGSVSEDDLTAGGVTGGESGTPSAKTGATEGLHSAPRFGESPLGDPFSPTTPAKTATKTGGEMAESLTPPGGETSPGASEVLSTAGADEHEHSGVNGHLSETVRLGLDCPPALDPFDGDVGSGLEDNDDGFDSEPEETPLIEEERIAIVPMVMPLLFAESEEEEEGGLREPDGVAVEPVGGNLAVPEEDVCEPEVVKKKAKKPAKGPGRKHVAGGSKGRKSKGGKVGKGGGVADKGSNTTRGEATPDEQRAWKSYDRVFKRSFMRVMLPSHVGGGYWLGVPIPTANRFMKRGQCAVTFESGGSKHSVVWLWRAPDRPPRNGEKSQKTKSDSRGFSGGWKGFARDHGLVTGDAVVFEKVGNRRFRLHLFRRSALGGSVEKAAKAANELAERLDGEGGGKGLELSGGQKKRAAGGDETEVGDGRSVAKQAKPANVSGDGTTGGTTGTGVPGGVANKQRRGLDEGMDGVLTEKRRKVGVDERGGKRAEKNGISLIGSSAPGVELQTAAERRVRASGSSVGTADAVKGAVIDELTDKKKRPKVEDSTKPEKGPLAERPSTGERMDMEWNKEKRGLVGQPPAQGDPPVGTRQAKVTEIFPVVKRAKVGVSKDSAKREEGRSGTKVNGAEAQSSPAGNADVTAVTTAGRKPERTGGSGGAKRIKHTPKRGVSQVLGGKKRARDEGKEPPKKLQKGARGGVVPEERNGGTTEEPEAEYEGGRLVHYVDGGHRYVEASEADKGAAKVAMERCASAFPTFRVALSKSQTDKGFRLGGMTDFFRQNGLEPFRMTALADDGGRLWHAKINSQAAALSGGWRGFALDHRLEVGDALVFALVLPYVFAVRIFKASRGGKEDDCVAAGGASEGQPVRGEERILSGDQKKRLATIRGLPGGLPSRNQKPPRSAPTLPSPQNGNKRPTSKPAQGSSLARADVAPKDKGGALEKAFSGGTKTTKSALSGGSNGAPPSAARKPAVNRTWPVIPRTATAVKRAVGLGPSGPQTSEHAGPSRKSDEPCKVEASGKVVVFGSAEASGMAETSGKAEVSGGSGPSDKRERSEKAGVSGILGPSRKAETLERTRASGNSVLSGEAETSGKAGVIGNGGATEPFGLSAELGASAFPKAGTSDRGGSAKPEANASALVSTVVQIKHSKVAVAFRVDRKKKGGLKSNAELMAERLNML